MFAPTPKQASSLVDVINGVLVRVERKGEVVAEYRYPSSLKAEWKEGATSTASN